MPAPAPAHSFSPSFPLGRPLCYVDSGGGIEIAVTDRIKVLNTLESRLELATSEVSLRWKGRTIRGDVMPLRLFLNLPSLCASFSLSPPLPPLPPPPPNRSCLPFATCSLARLRTGPSSSRERCSRGGASTPPTPSRSFALLARETRHTRTCWYLSLIHPWKEGLFIWRQQRHWEGASHAQNLTAPEEGPGQTRRRSSLRQQGDGRTARQVNSVDAHAARHG